MKSITARPLLFRDVTIDWLKYHGVRYTSIAFTENKLQECIDSEVSVLVDDAPHYAKEFAEKNIPVILFEQPYNTFVKIDMVYRASNWLEVSRRISELEVSNISTIV
ncbi:5' nucleotidase, NT5C type [Paenibacillus violae]|uniref:5' nucleotidase, NT5C type n=1 Tax=Paenibacillus TaxID=44249 RepID=UPI0037432389